MPNSLRLLLLLLGAVLSKTALAQSDINSDLKFAWGENIGWTNGQHDRPNPADGVLIADTYLAGYLWAENIGWINLGDGTPADGVHYANQNGDDFGVNLDASSGELSGFGWGENVGWVNFLGGALADPPNPARYARDDGACRLRGLAWGENVGWINLDNAEKFIGVTHDRCVTLRGDLNCDDAVNFDDIDPFVAALISEEQYVASYPDCRYANADINQDSAVNFDDIDGFVECLIYADCE